jgi:NitT/TauT family transport system substrate-binding protein
MHKRILAAAVVAAMALTGCGGSDDKESTSDVGSKSEPMKVRYASVGGLTDGPIYLANAMGFFEEEGLEVEITRMPNAAALGTALATGNLDVSAVSTAPALFNSISQGVSVKLVADKQSNQGDKGFGLKLVATSKIVQAKEAGQGGAALKGAKVAISAKNTASDKILTDLLEHFGLKASDITVVELPYPDMAAALQSGRVDAAIDLEPFLTRILKADDNIKVFSDLSEVVPVGAPVVPLVYSEAFTKNTEAADGFMRAYLRGTGVMNQALVGSKQDHDKVVSIIAKEAELPVDVVESAQPPGNNPCVPLDVTWIKEAQAFFVERGVVKQAVDVAASTDTTIGDRARKELMSKNQLDYCKS